VFYHLSFLHPTFCGTMQPVGFTSSMFYPLLRSDKWYHVISVLASIDTDFLHAPRVSSATVTWCFFYQVDSVRDIAL
jgi:hypothetical protein